MDRTEQKKDDKNQAISPLAQDKTYGEKVYSGIFDWGLNYWANLLSSAGFSHWAEHSTAQIKAPFMKKSATPRQIQEDLADWFRTKDIFINGWDPFKGKSPFGEGPLLKGLFTKTLEKEGLAVAESVAAKRSMARARSITLLAPGFLIMIPSVWLGAKIKPWLVETMNKMHYGAEAMDDPSLKARHEAIRAEDRPTLFGATMARFGSFFAAQTAAQLVGSENNMVNKLGKRLNNEALSNFGIDESAEKIGEKLGGMVPDGLQKKFNTFARKNKLNWSKTQIAERGALGEYTNAAQDLGRFIVADTFYTLISMSAVRPALALIKRLPGVSYKPKVPENSASFEGHTIKVPSNHYADVADTAPTIDMADHTTPATTISNVREHAAPARREHQIA